MCRLSHPTGLLRFELYLVYRTHDITEDVSLQRHFEPAGADEVLAVVRIVEIPVGHYLSGVRGMDEPALARVDPHVVDATLAAAEEDEVARHQVIPFDALSRTALIGRRPRHFHAQLVEAVVHEPAAVETLRALAPE